MYLSKLQIVFVQIAKFSTVKSIDPVRRQGKLFLPLSLRCLEIVFVQIERVFVQIESVFVQIERVFVQIESVFVQVENFSLWAGLANSFSPSLEMPSLTDEVSKFRNNYKLLKLIWRLSFTKKATAEIIQARAKQNEGEGGGAK